MALTKKKKNNKNSSLKSKSTTIQKCADTYQPFEDIFEKGNYGIINDNKYQKQLIKIFKTPYAPTTVTPQEDFYTYINYSWIKDRTEKDYKTYYTQQDSFRIVQEKVYYDLMDIVKDYCKDNKTKKAKELDKVYNSFLTLDEKVAKGHLDYYVNNIQQHLQNGNLITLLADINKNEVISWGCPLVWSLSADQKNANIYQNYIELPRLSIYDYTIYIEDEKDDVNTKKYKKLFKKKYFEFLNTVFNTCVGSKYGYKAQDVWDVEYELLTAMGCNEIKKESPDFYNIVTKKEALEKYGFDWEEFSHCLGYAKCPDFFICGSLNYLKCVMALLKKDNNWKSKKWEAFFIYLGARQIMRFHKKWKNIYFEFFGKFVTGQAVPMPDAIYPIFGLSLCFNTLLTNQYVSKFENQTNIDYVFNMGHDLLKVFKRIISRNTWLSPPTKKYALLKLNHLKLIVGSPKLLREDPLLDYRSNDPWGNVQKITQWRTMKQINLEGKETIDIPIIDWFKFKLTGTQAYVVNAYYTPTLNSIYVPLGYLQKPFIDLDERGMEYNLAHIGYTLGHEMSHSLDDNGSKYDYKGNLNNWWTPHDRKIFDSKVKNVIKQYETFASYDGIKMDASLGTGEDLADISGLAICQEFLRDFQIKNKDAVSVRSLSFQLFFEYIAIQDRQKIYDEAVKAQLKINPHPMNKYRTNCPLARLKLFQSIYNVKKGDKMYWSETDTIWG